MNYLAFISEFMASKAAIADGYLNEDNRRLISRLGIAWGLQRNFEKRFSLDLYLGFGYLISNGTTYNSGGQRIKRNITMPALLGQLNLGIWLNKRKTADD
jgi:hypothetical protein